MSDEVSVSYPERS